MSIGIRKRVITPSTITVRAPTVTAYGLRIDAWISPFMVYSTTSTGAPSKSDPEALLITCSCGPIPDTTMSTPFS